MSKALAYSGATHARSAIPLIGGKHGLVPSIVPVLEYAAGVFGLDSFYELCGGGCRKILNIPDYTFKYRCYNDLDIGLCNFFACLADYADVHRLMGRLEELGASEEVFHWALSIREYEADLLARGSTETTVLDRVTSAAATFICARLSRAADAVTINHSRVSDLAWRRSYLRKVRALSSFYPTMRGVEITHGDCLEWLDVLRNRDALVYLDPPYHPEAMIEKTHYGSVGERSWSVADHELLVDNLLLMGRAKIVLSGYDNPVYDRLVRAGWTRVYLRRVSISSAAVKGRWQDEYVWLNFDLPSSIVDQVSECNYSAMHWY